MEWCEGLWPQPAFLVEVAPRQPFDSRGTAGPRAKHHLPLGPVAEKHLGVGRLKAPGQRPLAAGFLRQLRQRELDVLAGAQRVDGEIRAGAEVFARGHAPDGHAIGPFRLRIEDLELGEDFLPAHVLQLERLLPAELPPQGGLPLGQRHVVGFSQPGELFLGRLARLGRPGCLECHVLLLGQGLSRHVNLRKRGGLCKGRGAGVPPSPPAVSGGKCVIKRPVLAAKSRQTRPAGAGNPRDPSNSRVPKWWSRREIAVTA